jgi:hypothetical protein
MQAETVELLSVKGKFPMEQALVLAEAMDLVIEKAQFVTVPILDARIAIVNARIDALEAKLEAELDAKFERWTTRMIIAMVLSQTATGPIGMQVFESLKQVLATLGR